MKFLDTLTEALRNIPELPGVDEWGHPVEILIGAEFDPEQIDKEGAHQQIKKWVERHGRAIGSGLTRPSHDQPGNEVWVLITVPQETAINLQKSTDEVDIIYGERIELPGPGGIHVYGIGNPVDIRYRNEMFDDPIL